MIDRKAIPAATQAALIALSNGRCYAPTCSQPVIVEVRPGVYRKNVRIAHIYGVAPGAPRHQKMPAEERDAFKNLLLLCVPHHDEIDDRTTGQTNYPAPMLLDWKARREGDQSSALAALGPISEQQLTEMLLGAFTPPLNRLEQITKQLEQTGTLNAATVAELRQVVDMLTHTAASTDAAAALSNAADVLSSGAIASTADELLWAADVLSSENLHAAAGAITQAAEVLQASVEELKLYGGQL